MRKEFHYVIARNWTREEHPSIKSLCVYSIWGEVQYGTIEHARLTLDYVKNVTKDEHKESYRIYKLNPEVIQ